MKKITIFLIIFATCSAVFGQKPVVTSHTALTLPKGRLDFGILHPMVIGITDSVDLVTHPLLDILFPNVGVKVNWANGDGFYFSTQHGLSYATLLLNTISKPGVGGILPPDNIIPQVISLDNQLLASYYSGIHLASFKFGVKLALKIPNVVFDTIDYPLIFTSTAEYHTPVVFSIEANYRLLLAGKIALLFDGGIWLMPTPIEAFEVRQTSKVLFSFSRIFSVYGGYMLTIGNYPYGLDWKVFPLIDVVFSFGGNK